MFERYSFVAITTKDLPAARNFWAGTLGFKITEEEAGHHFIVDAGGLRLCVDTADGKQHKSGSSDPVIGLKVKSLDEVISRFKKTGIAFDKPMDSRSYVRIQDPDGRTIVVTERD